MTNREKLYEIAGRLGADADLAVVRAALLALIRVLLGVDGARPVAHAVGIDAVVAGIVTQQTPRERRSIPEHEPITIDGIKKMILGSFGVCQGGGVLVEPRIPSELFLAANMKLMPMCRQALDELVEEGSVARTEERSASGAFFYELTKLGAARKPPKERCSAVDDIQRERDAMVARSRRGIQRDDEKTPEDWAASLRKVIDPAHSIVMGDVPGALRHMWVKVGAVALRVIESIDRKGDARKPETDGRGP